MANILIIDDDHALCDALAAVITSMGHSPACEHTLKDGLAKAEKGGFEAIVLDVWLPDGNGLDHIHALRECPSSPEVIILTGSADPDGAELAIRSGAWDYITKPPTLSKIKLPVQRALEFHHNKHSHLAGNGLKREAIIGDSNAIRACLNLVAQAASTEINVLITGETGTGKELFARAIHDNSKRAENSFVVVDCASLPENLVESMLFGHEKGAFTNADRKYEGLVKQAHGGTLFLDEVGELPFALQKTFLRVLQEHRFRPVGAIKEIVSEFRLVAATNRDLEEMVAQGTFRQDLLFRLQAVNIHLPPLRGRAQDIRKLARHLAKDTAQRLDLKPKKLTKPLLEALARYDWPGNVRELAGALEHAVAAGAMDKSLAASHLPTNIRAQLAREGLDRCRAAHVPVVDQTHPAADNGSAVQPDADPTELPDIKEFRAQAMADLERDYLNRLMAATGGDIPRACTVSGLSRARLYALLKKYDIGRTIPVAN